MQTLRKFLACDKYTKIENAIPTLDSQHLSDGGVRLYLFLATLPISKEVTDQFLLTSLGISKKSLWKYKKELKALDLVHIKKIKRGQYYIYVGSLAMGASKVEQYWEEIDIHTGKPLTLKDLEKIRRNS
jgi:hypothetical protein